MMATWVIEWPDWTKVTLTLTFVYSSTSTDKTADEETDKTDETDYDTLLTLAINTFSYTTSLKLYFVKDH